MAWYLRKSVKMGPVRFNLSKSGIGTSVGVKGFRVGVRPNGKSYIHAGRYGLYYRQEFNTKKATSKNKPEIIQEIQETENFQSHPDAIRYESVSSQKLSPKSREELISILNKSYTEFRLDYLCGILFIILSILLLNKNDLLGIISIIIGIITTIYVAFWESKRRTVTITYDFEDEKANSFKQLITAFNFLATNEKVWALIDSRNIQNSHESKLNAGASNVISRSDVEIGEGKPPWVNTNIDVPVLKARNQTLYMMPDGILVYDSRGVGFVDYPDVFLQQNTTRFIEESPPNDAKIVDSTWKFPNKSGGPDRRFKDNYEIPICLYGELSIKSKTGMFFYLMTSQYDSPLKFYNQFRNILKQ